MEFEELLIKKKVRFSSSRTYSIDEISKIDFKEHSSSYAIFNKYIAGKHYKINIEDISMFNICLKDVYPEEQQ